MAALAIGWGGCSWEWLAVQATDDTFQKAIGNVWCGARGEIVLNTLLNMY